MLDGEGIAEGAFEARGMKGWDIMAKSSTTLVTMGCAAAVAMALVGAAYAIDAPAPREDILMKGDRVAPVAGGEPNALTVEEVNLDAGISNLIRVKAEPAVM
ncbi:hypothetical protein [Chthonobacter rhizosphaerae]|uniref:hypothetical protein n=1 Tax=Chthonobacter rhizosphaerae TaxID=2735553 RepID=UPI0015EEA03C|nr:hypothetical protein [Chthonobacter rhizosphaerae]